MKLIISSGFNREFSDQEVACPNCVAPNPVFQKFVTTSKKYSAPISQKKHDLASVILTLLIVFGGCGGAEAIFNGTPGASFLPLSIAIVGIFGLIVMRIRIQS